ncbi:hypothetical protein ACJO15_20530 [Vibrio parahaemolyticus]|uniref:hypothetical protein n=2 Tax=Vibrio parahaemolyticus TaxID=670 RepID=UPI002B3D28DA|nr:hypothetical protein [Vibrio parahaemolyticus]MEA5299239.1 hypothetical protein [Vibrio parahaemolyticus]
MANNMIIEQLKTEIATMKQKLNSAKAVNDSYKPSVSEALRRGVAEPMVNYRNQLMTFREFEALLAAREAELEKALKAS